jgi:hypothetical protein
MAKEKAHELETKRADRSVQATAQHLAELIRKGQHWATHLAGHLEPHSAFHSGLSLERTRQLEILTGQRTQRVRHWVRRSGSPRARPMVRQKEHDSAPLKAIQRDGPLERLMDWGLVLAIQ